MLMTADVHKPSQTIGKCHGMHRCSKFTIIHSLLGTGLYSSLPSDDRKTATIYDFPLV